MAETGKLLEVKPRTGHMYIVPAHGYLEALEIRFTPPQLNMDAAREFRLIIEPLDGAPPFQLFARVRDVHWPEA